METFVICAENHDTKEFPSILFLKAIYQEEVIPNQVEPLCFIAKRPWQNPQSNMTQAFNIQTYAQPSQSNWTTPMPWKPWPQPRAQGWKNPYGKYPKYPQFQQPYPIFPPQYFPESFQPSQPQNPNPQLSLPFP